jgi:hypothetical protein
MLGPHQGSLQSEKPYLAGYNTIKPRVIITMIHEDRLVDRRVAQEKQQADRGGI